MSGSGRLVVVSNRLPSTLSPNGRVEEGAAPVGGLVTALSSALEQRGGLWVGWSGRIGDRSGESPRTEMQGQIQLAAIDLTRSENNLFYNGFCNRTLWPILHSFPFKMVVRHDSYRSYIRTNRVYAEVVASLLKKDDTVWVHDFHLIPLGHELRKLGWKGKIGFFLHTPFPPAEVFAVMPWARQLLDMILDYDLFGVHTRGYLRNLFDSLADELDGVTIGNTFVSGGRSMQAGAWPIGIDAEGFRKMAVARQESTTGSYIHEISPDHQIVLGVDRLDYTKGIIQRLITFEHLLERYPALRGKVSLVQISAPSRSRVPEYVEERQHVDQLVGRINGRFSVAEWVPVRYLYRSIPQDELVAFYRESQVCLITPLRDGMNLVAKEFVASQGDDPGVVVLSKFCGASETMKQGLIVNPYDVESTAEAIHRALKMPKHERISRWNSLMEIISTYTASAWSDSFLNELETEPGS
jgi:trehalose 6-phosphate synthase